MRWTALGLAVAVAMLGSAQPASAGGAVWSFDRASYAPGETALAGTAVGWGHNEELGTPADGPYFAYIMESQRFQDVVVAWPGVPDEAILVGQVEIGIGPFEESPGFLVGPNHALVEFVVPDVAPGTYDLLHCNRPCTTTLGDITWGQLVVRAGPPAAVRPAVDVAAAPAAGDDAPERSVAPWLIGIAVAIALGGTVTTAVVRSNPLASAAGDRPSSGGGPPDDGDPRSRP